MAYRLSPGSSFSDKMSSTEILSENVIVGAHLRVHRNGDVIVRIDLFRNFARSHRIPPYFV